MSRNGEERQNKEDHSSQSRELKQKEVGRAVGEKVSVLGMVEVHYGDCRLGRRCV